MSPSDRTAQAVTDGPARLFQNTGLDEWTVKLVSVSPDGAAVNVSLYDGAMPKRRPLSVVEDSLIMLILESETESADPNVSGYHGVSRSVFALLHLYLQTEAQNH